MEADVHGVSFLAIMLNDLASESKIIEIQSI
jgi:hypothetical protein